MLESGMDLRQTLDAVHDTDELIIGADILDRCAPMLRKYWSSSRVLLVADSNTWNAAGRKLSSILEKEGFDVSDPLIFEVPPALHADYENVGRIVETVSNIKDAVPVSVGSGTVNDLVKRAAFELGTAYMCVGTAASMDGYCSSGAALAKNGRKQTMECPAPKVIIADTEVLKTAPAISSAAGYGDLASKLTAGADWIIADFTGVEAIDPETWSIIQPRLEHWLKDPAKISMGDSEALSGVFEGLNMSGLAMQYLGRSRAASGAEHMFSHVWEMSNLTYADGSPVLHGIKVSLGILCVTALMEEVFKREAADIDIGRALAVYPSWEERAAEVELNMKELPSWQEYLDLCREKYLPAETLEQRLTQVKEDWDELRDKVRKRLPSYKRMREMLSAAGCPVTAEEINLTRNDAIKTYAKTQCLRNRYTILDLAYELGIFHDCVSAIAESPEYLS